MKGAQQLRQRIDQSIAFRFMCKNMWIVTRVLTKNEDLIGTLLPAFHILFFFVICSLGLYGDERPGAVAEIRFSMRWQ